MERPRARLSLAPMRVKMRSMMGSLAWRAGTNEPILRHQDDERGLAEIGGLAAHVRAGDQEKLLACGLEVEIVGDEALASLAQEFFDDRMAAADDQEFAAGGEFGS